MTARTLLAVILLGLFFIAHIIQEIAVMEYATETKIVLVAMKTARANAVILSKFNTKRSLLTVIALVFSTCSNCSGHGKCTDGVCVCSGL